MFFFLTLPLSRSFLCQPNEPLTLVRQTEKTCAFCAYGLRPHHRVRPLMSLSLSHSLPLTPFPSSPECRAFVPFCSTHLWHDSASFTDGHVSLVAKAPGQGDSTLSHPWPHALPLPTARIPFRHSHLDYSSTPAVCQTGSLSPTKQSQLLSG